MRIFRLLLIFACLYNLPSIAQTIIIPVAQQGNNQLPVPKQGQHLNSVVREYGQPITKHPAVGQPPIIRWDYTDFSVYFQGTTVIHSVHTHQPQQPISSQP